MRFLKIRLDAHALGPGPYDRTRIDLLWTLRAQTDSRIEPIAVGERQWREDTASAIIEIARREGQEIPAPSVP